MIATVATTDSKMAKNDYIVRVRQRLGKYRIERKIAEGGFANVYEAYDSVEGIRVALKIPHPRLMNESALKDFRREVRLTVSLEHPNILQLKTADYVDDVFVIVYPLGERTLAERLRSRLSTPVAVHLAEQLLEALAYAHQHRIVHCDVKPENCILFDQNRLRLADFGIAKVAMRTLSGGGAGTIGYLAPEQAMGKPSFRSDVFSLGVVIYEMLTGYLPEWPYDWPPPGVDTLRRKMPPEMVDFIRRAIEIDERKRFKDAGTMLAAFRRMKPRITQAQARRRRRSRKKLAPARDWKVIRYQEFRRRYGKELDVRATCGRCRHPIGESMTLCPWCGFKPKVYRGPTRFPKRCRRCGRGQKLDWRFCAWCYGPGLDCDESRQYSDVRYGARCRNPSCKRKTLMPFMRYCPWCRAKIVRKWKISESDTKCSRCGWGVLLGYWDLCPWCGKRLDRKVARRT